MTVPHTRPLARRLGTVAIATCLAACTRQSRASAYLARADTALRQQKYPDVIQQSQRALQEDGNDARATALLGRAHLELAHFAQAYDYLLRARDHDPTLEGVRLDLANFYVLESRLDDAREQARAIAKSDSANLAAQMLLGVTARSSKQLADAIHALNGLTPSAAQMTRYHVALGIFSLRRNDTASARQQLRDAVGREPNSAEAHAALADYESAVGNRTQADVERRAAESLIGASATRRLEVARFFADLGQRSEARQWLAAIPESDSTWLPARRLLAELQLTDRDSAAPQTISIILARDSSDAEALLQRGRARLAAHDAKGAAADFRRVLHEDPRLAPAHYELAMAELAQRDSVQPQTERPDPAVALAASELDSAAKLTPKYPDATLALAELRLRTGHARDAIEDLDRFVRDNPESIRATELLAAILSASGRADEANEAFHNVIAIDPDRAESHYELGVALQTSNKKAEAAKEFETALTLAPAYADPMTQLVLMDLADAKSGAALDRIDEQLKRAPGSAALYDLLGLVHAARNEQTSAESAYRRAIQLDPSLVDARVRLAEMCDATGRFDEAIAQADSVRRLEPGNLRALMALGVGHQQRGDTALARNAYEAALAVNPAFAGAANNLAYLLSEEPGQQEKAYTYALLAKKIAPDDPHVADTFGWILYKRGEYARAMTVLKQAATKLADSPAVLYHLGMTAQKMGDTGTARAALERAVAAPIDFRGKDEARRTLGQLK